MSARGGRSLGGAVALAVLLLIAGGWWLLRREQERAGAEHYQYDLDAYRKVPEELLRYRETAQLPTGLEAPRGIAAAGGDRIVVSGDSRLVILAGDGKRLGGFAIKGRPGPVAADGGDVFVGLGGHLAVYTLSGQHRADWTGLGEKAVITSIAVDGDDVFIADYGNRIVWRFDRSGALRARIGEKDEARGVQGFVVPSPLFDVAAAPGTGLWVADSGRRRLELYDRDGKPLKSWGRASVDIDGFSGCCNPSHAALLPDGSIVTSEKGLVRVKVYSSEGKLSAVVAGPRHFGQTSEAPDVAVDSRGRILALDPRGKFVRVFEKIAEKTP